MTRHHLQPKQSTVHKCFPIFTTDRVRDASAGGCRLDRINDPEGVVLIRNRGNEELSIVSLRVLLRLAPFCFIAKSTQQLVVADGLKRRLVFEHIDNVIQLSAGRQCDRVLVDPTDNRDELGLWNIDICPATEIDNRVPNRTFD